MNIELIIIIIVTQLAIKTNGQASCQNPDIKTCRECVSASYRCVWCADQDFSPGLSRCNTEEHWNKRSCSDRHGDKQTPTPVVKNNREFSDKMDETVQLRPQKVEVSMRAESVVEIPIYYKQAQDYPMDLYYLMDLSCTMLKHKKRLANVGKRIAEAMKQTTSNFKIGFGSYVDKPVMPYSSFNIELSKKSINTF